MFEKHLWKSGILSKDAGQHFASKNQQPGFYKRGTLMKNGLRVPSVNVTKSAVCWRNILMKLLMEDFIFCAVRSI